MSRVSIWFYVSFEGKRFGTSGSIESSVFLIDTEVHDFLCELRPDSKKIFFCSFREDNVRCITQHNAAYSYLPIWHFHPMISMLSQGREMLHDGNISKQNHIHGKFSHVILFYTSHVVEIARVASKFQTRNYRELPKRMSGHKMEGRED